MLKRSGWEKRNCGSSKMKRRERIAFEIEAGYGKIEEEMEKKKNPKVAKEETDQPEPEHETKSGQEIPHLDINSLYKFFSYIIMFPPSLYCILPLPSYFSYPFPPCKLPL